MSAYWSRDWHTHHLPVWTDLAKFWKSQTLKGTHTVGIQCDHMWLFFKSIFDAKFVKVSIASFRLLIMKKSKIKTYQSTFKVFWSVALTKYICKKSFSWFDQKWVLMTMGQIMLHFLPRLTALKAKNQRAKEVALCLVLTKTCFFIKKIGQSRHIFYLFLVVSTCHNLNW